MPPVTMADQATRPAGFWERYAAWSLDAALISLPVWLLSAAGLRSHARALVDGFVALTMMLAQRLADTLMEGGSLLQTATTLAHEPAAQAAMAAVLVDLRTLLLPPLAWFAVFAATYWIAFERSPLQATPGKRALALRVDDLEGQPLHWGRAAARHFAGALSWLTLNLGHALAAWTPQKRALHDYAAGTRVSATRGDDSRLPWWAKGWVLLQVLAALALLAWFYLSLLDALRLAINNA